MHAVSAETGQTVWKYEQRAATLSLAVTGAGLEFGSDVNGCFLELTPELRPSSGNNLFVFPAHRATPAHDGTAPPGLDVKPSDVASTLLAAARKLVRRAIRAGGGGDRVPHEKWAGTLIPAGRTVPLRVPVGS